MYDARHIANEFIRRAREANRGLTHIQIQNLVYFAHARMLSLHRRPLILEEFQARLYGPVAPGLYDALKHNRSEPVRDDVPVVGRALLPLRVRDILDWSFDRYGRLSGAELARLTHAPGTPWARTSAGAQNQVIPNSAIEEYYAAEWSGEAAEAVERLSSDPTLREEVSEAIAQFERGEYQAARTPDQLRRVLASCAGSA